MRREPTEAERRMWRLLRDGLPWARFRRQVPIGRYIADFASHTAKIVIELDGNQHAEQADYDRARDAFLAAEGYLVVRFWNHDVAANPDGLLQTVADHLAARGGGGPPVP